MSKKQDHLKIINQWVERDLAQESSEGSLSKAFEVDGILDQLTECILSRRNPIITGESGIGKTSIIHELVRRIESGKTLVELQGYQVLQLSLRQRASGLKQPNSQMRSEMQKLVTAFLDSNCNIIPYFRDLHLAYTFHLEPQLQLLAFQLAVSILAEGEGKTIQSMLEETLELCQQFLPINIEEPSLTTARRILELWSEEQQKQSRLDFSPDAREEALYLSHRFLARDRLPRKALDLLTHAGSLVEDGRTITGANVIARFCSHHRVPDLLAQINEPEFWDRIEYREEVLERYRALDVAIRMRKRFAEPILHLAELLENNTPAPANLSPELERAANSLRQWEDCLAEEGHAEVWMVLSTSDPLKPAGQWIRKLANMELAWSRKIGLTASVAAYSIAEGELNRAVLEIEGPGAEIYLTMEHGIHRLHFPRAKDSKVRVEILPNRPSKDNSRGDIRAIKHRRGEFNMELRCKGRVEIENRGYIVELFAENESVLSRMLPGLARAWSKQPAEVDVSRIYGKDGVIHDPRTGVTSNRIKEVWKGGLDEFLEGWRRTKG